MEGREIKIRINPKIFWYLIFALLIIFLAILIKRTFFTEKYVGVYFLNGELYIGRLIYLPKMKLTDAYFYRVDQQTGNNVLIPINQLPWQPQNKIYLNKNQILWIAPLDENSQALSLIKNRIRGNLNQPNLPVNNQFIQNQPPINPPNPNQNNNINQNQNQNPPIEEEINQ
ncbi:MAG: hypothetical protein NZ866_01895 [Patescibacteria group bacterium]|nr:hypothetical protein [Patescibacteria group bacterium]